MSGALSRTWRVAVSEWCGAMRSRRALVMTLLFVAVASLVMYGTVSIFSAMEQEVLNALRLPATDAPGSVTLTLWKSKPFLHVMERLAGGSLVFADIKGRHPMLLAYAMFIFQIVPLLTLMVSAPRVAEDLRDGSARYWLVRVTRTEWSLGKFLGEAMLLASAMLVGAFAAWAVVTWRLPGWGGLGLLPGLLDWSARAWVYAFGWLGLFMGVSHVARSGGKATALGIVAMLVTAAWPHLLDNLAECSEWLEWTTHLDALVPRSAWTLLWRRSPSAVLLGAAHLATLSFLYLAAGAAAFGRRDA